MAPAAGQEEPGPATGGKRFAAHGLDPAFFDNLKKIAKPKAVALA